MTRLALRLAIVTIALLWLSAPLAAAAASDTAALPIAAPSRADGATVARIVVPTEARSRPGGGAKLWFASTATSWSAEPQSLLVMGSASHDGRQWLRVLLPVRPDGTTGWILRDNVALSTTHYWITVNKRSRTVTVYSRGVQVRRFLAVIGKPATPTPDGLAAIWERDRQPDAGAFLGTWALPLTLLSNVLYDFGGGPGRIAIHGRGGASLENPLGSAASHGCIRVDNREVDWLATHVSQGTPVDITG